MEYDDYFDLVVDDPYRTPSRIHTNVGEHYLAQFITEMAERLFVVRAPVFFEAFQWASDAADKSTTKHMTQTARKHSFETIQACLVQTKSAHRLTNVHIQRVLSGGFDIGEWTPGPYLTLFRWSKHPHFAMTLIRCIDWWDSRLAAALDRLPARQAAIAQANQLTAQFNAIFEDKP